MLAPALVVASLLVGVVGLVDAVGSGDGDAQAVTAMVLVLQSVLLVVLSTGARSVSVRADQYRWLARRAAAGGERIRALHERALDSYRSQLGARPGEPPG